MENVLDFFLRILVAGILAGLIGLDREMNSKEAGLRTHFLVGVGSALFMIISKYGFSDIIALNNIGLDPSRIAAQVVSGISFLGAGTILLEKRFIKGLTTAAGIWATAAIGLAVGSGMYEVGIFATFIVFVILKFSQKFLDLHFFKKIQGSKLFNVSIKMSKYPDNKIGEVLSNENYILSSFKTEKSLEDSISIYNIHFIIRAKKEESSLGLAKKLNDIDDVMSVEIENM